MLYHETMYFPWESSSSKSSGKRKRDSEQSNDKPLEPVTVSGTPSSSVVSDEPSQQLSASGPDAVATAAPASKAKPTGKPATKKQASRSIYSPITCSIPWPPAIRQLDRTHRALNLVFTFCCTRKHLATTFDAIRSTVESRLSSAGGPRYSLEVREVAAVVAVRPEGVRFGYVDENTLRMDVRGTERDETFLTGAGKGTPWGQSIPSDESVGGLTGLEGLGSGAEGEGSGGGSTSGSKEVLYFEFVDGDLKREVASSKPGGELVKSTRRLRDENLKMPAYSQKQMMQLIERRNQKFVNALNLFVNRCVERGEDPEKRLWEEAEKHIPVPSAPEEDVRPPLSDTLPPSIPTERKSIPEIVEELKALPWYTGQIVPDGHRVFEPQEAIFGDLDFLMSQDLVNALYNAKGITQLYAHQAEAINALHSGQHVVVATSTSSGKSLIYQLPVLHALQSDRDTRAMYIFPTKALAQDQRRSIREMLAFMPGLEDLLVETFDGDTPFRERNRIRDEARIIFTNPDMLHLTILPNEERWRTFLRNLRYVVVDELHYYNGLIGSHVAFVMRRLRRVCAALGNRHVRFVSCSATVANPLEHFEKIFGIASDRVRLVDYDGSPSGRKEFLCWNTPYKDPGDPHSGRGSAELECARLFCQLILRGVRVIAFCRVREQCERLTGAVKTELAALGRGEVSARVMGYRGGYTAEDRRRIEADMFEGRLVGVVATTALELGVDIGSLDCVLTWGFPYTIANLRQQSGRAGRRNRDSLSILVGDSFAVDQYYMQNPDELFTKPNCELLVDLENMLVREGHVQCAAYEVPIDPVADACYFGDDLPSICAERLVLDEHTGFYHCHDRFRPSPSRFVQIRDTEDDHFAIIDVTHGRNVVLEELEASRATFTLYDGAIFLHQGNSYLVKDFNPEKGMAKVEKVNVDWTTTQRDFTDIDPVETEAIRRLSGSPRSHIRPALAYHGSIRITQVVYGFFKVDRRGRVLDAVAVDNPPVVRHSKGMWLDVPPTALEILRSRNLSAAAAIHAAEHAVLSLLPTYVVSRPGDVRTECKNARKEIAAQQRVRTHRPETKRKRPARLTFYDAKGGPAGSGISTKAFEFIDLLLNQALARVEGCGCDAGCPECVADIEACIEPGGGVLSKAGCTVVLRSLLGLEVDVESLPMGPEPGTVEFLGSSLTKAEREAALLELDKSGGETRSFLAETVVEAMPVRPRDRKTLRIVGDVGDWAAPPRGGAGIQDVDPTS